ncbi:MAG: glyoxalase [Candidatus Eremiobacteraeota bacterium]|nr:glyoxalase [Candidatus Eremiobacteraeota bacterium]
MTATLLYDHVDARVASLAGSRALYDALLPALGFSDIHSFDDGVVYYHESHTKGLPFFGLILDESHRPNGTRIAFAVANRREVDRIASVAQAAGALKFESPAVCPEYSDDYYASFFEDGEGNKLEVCYRISE